MYLFKVSVLFIKDILWEVATTIEGAAFIVYDIKVLGLEIVKMFWGLFVVILLMVLNVSSIDMWFSFMIGWNCILFNVFGVLDILSTNI